MTHSRRVLTRLATAATAIAMTATAAAGCGALGGGEGDRPDNPGRGLETTTLKVGLSPTMDTIPARLGASERFFADEGLDVEFVNVPGGNTFLDKLGAGELDLSFGTYAPGMLAQAQGAFNGDGGLKIVAGASSLKKDAAVVMAMAEGPVQDIHDLAGKKIAVTSETSITTLWIRQLLAVNHVDASKIQWVQTRFPELAQALTSGDVDAGFATEPWIQATMQQGAQSIVDIAQGELAQFPAAGYFATGDWVAEHPKTVAAFQRAMTGATKFAIGDRIAVNAAAVEAFKSDQDPTTAVDNDAAQMSNLPEFESGLAWKRIQKVPDFMQRLGVLKVRVDVQKMIIPTPDAN